MRRRASCCKAPKPASGASEAGPCRSVHQLPSGCVEDIRRSSGSRKPSGQSEQRVPGGQVTFRMEMEMLKTLSKFSGSLIRQVTSTLSKAGWLHCS